jgi:hypothetical protein
MSNPLYNEGIETIIAIAPYPYNSYEVGYITYNSGIAPFWRNLITEKTDETTHRFNFGEHETCVYVAIGYIASQCALLWDDEPDKWLTFKKTDAHL